MHGPTMTILYYESPTRVSLLVKCTSQPSLSTLLLFLLVCLTDCTTRIRGMLLLVDGLQG